MKWKKVSEELSELLEKEMINYNCKNRIMFGCPAYFVNNNMFSGVHQNDLFIRLSEKDREKILLEPDTFIFEPMKGRPMKEYIVLPESMLDNEKYFKFWLDRSFEYVSSLPPREKSEKKKKNNTDEIRLSEVFEVDAKTLYQTWMNSKGHSEMTGGKARITNRISTKFQAWDDYISGKTLELDPYERVLQSWRTTDFLDEDEDSILEILFEEKKDKTKLILIHSNIPKGQGNNYKKGWIDYYFTPMKEYFKK